MRIHIRDLDDDQTITLSGSESWLEPVYAAFPQAEVGAAKRLLSGTLHLHRDQDAGSVHVHGALDFAPVLNCGRCEKGIAFPLNMAVDSHFFPEDTAAAEHDVTLTEADLDTYVLDHDEVDLEGLLIDTINLAIPTRLVITKDEDKTCAICGIDLSADRIYASQGEGTNEKSSPFAILKDLKLP